METPTGGYHRMPDGSLMRNSEMMGPRAKSPYDTRMDALASWKQRAEPEEQESLVKALLPLVVAQGLDFVSTEEPIGFLRRDDMSEGMNRFPGARAKGFGGTVGRVSSGAAEMLLAALLHKSSPKLGRMYMTPSMSTHTDLSRMNMAMANELDMRDRRPGRRR